MLPGAGENGMDESWLWWGDVVSAQGRSQARGRTGAEGVVESSALHNLQAHGLSLPVGSPLEMSF